MTTGKVSIGCDHADFPMKAMLPGFLFDKIPDVIDRGTYSAESVDYPDYVYPAAYDVKEDKIKRKVMLCGNVKM